jgi:hypothetical protein
MDRNISGVLLFTNDGDLAQKLSIQNEMKDLSCGSDKPLTKQHFEKIMGVWNWKTVLPVDEMAYADQKIKHNRT